MIQINKLHKYYNKGKESEIHVINDTTLSLPETGFVCILGESGSGKTTLLNTIGGLDDYESGIYSVDGATLNTYSKEQMDRLRTQYFGYVFQNYYLLMEHTVDYNIRLVLDMYDMTEEEKSERIDYVLNAVDMQKYKKRLVSQLSGGQQQRVAIARALAKTPKVIFADEPTGNLDESNTMRVMKILKKVSQNCLVVMVTHETRLAEVFAERVIRVENGVVVADSCSNNDGVYEYQDDSAIYLQEYEKESFELDGIQVEIYSDSKEDAKLPVTIRIIQENGRCYVQACAEDASITLIQPGGKKQVIDGKKPVLTIDEEDSFVFALESLPCKQMPKLSWGEIIRVAVSNLKQMGRRQAFLICCFLAMAVLLVLTVSDILTLNAIDVRSIVGTDARYISVETKKNGGYDLIDYNAYFTDFFEEYLETTDIDHVQYSYDTDLYFKYQGFEQIQDIKAMLTGYSLASIEELTEDDLILGRMPQRPNEIVVDTWVIEAFLEKEPSIAHLLPTVEDFLGKQITVDRKNWTLEIVGICDKNNPNLYMDRCTQLSITMRITDTMGSLAMLKQVFPDRYQDLELKENEVMVSESYYEHLKAIGSDGETIRLVGVYSYNVVGTYPDEFGMDAVISEKAYEEILRYLVLESKRFTIIAENKDKALAYFDSLSEETTEKLQVFVTDHYAEEIKVYEEARALKVDARLIITITIFIVSILLLYFSMKSNAIKKMDDIMVYRLLGIQKSSILLIFAMESVILTLYTSVPAVILTSGILKFIVSIPSLQLDLVYPWGAAFGIIGFLFVINAVTGVLPILRLVRKPPAQLTI